MGVKNLWRLLLPVGHRLSIETLAHQTLAIDASIWLTQVSKACRDPETGRLLPNRPHVRIFLLRLMRMLYHQIKPVLVFDGAMPEVKRREIQRRKHARERLWRDEHDGEKGGAAKRAAKKILVKQLKEWREKEARLKRGEGNEEEDGHEIDGKNPRRVAGGAANGGAFAAGFTLADDGKDAKPAGKPSDADGKNTDPSKSEAVKSDEVISINSEGSEEKVTQQSSLQLGATDEGQEDGSENDWDMQRAISESIRQPQPQQQQTLDFGNHYDDNPFEHSHYQQASNETIAALPSEARSKWIDTQRSQRRIESRRECIKAAANPEDYSNAQLKNFLKGSKLNKRVGEIGKLVERGAGDDEINGNGGGAGFVSVGGSVQRRPLQRQAHGSDSDDNGIFDNDAAQGGTSMKVLFGEDDSDDEEGGGGFLLPSSTAEPAATAAGKKDETILLDDDSGSKGGDDRKLPSKDQPQASTFPSKSSKLLELATAGEEWDNWGADGKEEGSAEIEHIASNATETKSAAAPMAQGSSESESNDDDGQGLLFALGGAGVPRASAKAELAELSRAPMAAAEGEAADDDEDDDDVDWEDGDSDGEQVDEDGMDAVGMKATSREQLGDYPVERNGRSDNKQIPIDLTKGDNNRSLEEQKEKGSEKEVIELPSSDEDVGMPKEDNASTEEVPAGLSLSLPDGNQSDLPTNKSVEILGDNEFDSFHPDNNTAAALEHAQETASRLTSWAGRAFQRAISAHVGENPHSIGSPTNKDAARSDDHIDVADSAMDVDASGNEEAASTKMNGESPATAKETDVGDNEQSPSPQKLDLLDTSLEGLNEAYDGIVARERAKEGDTITITEEMKDDILRLLQLCGIPWIESPSEAEAQCAALEELGLVDGVVTEDSDAFVFGAKKVYKNFVDQKKFVEAYYARDMQRDLALGKHQLVALAMLLGGDYTDGVKGVGIVNGMEILQAFPVHDSESGVKDGLQRFRNWLEGIDEVHGPGSAKEALFHKKHKSARTRWSCPSDFPSQAVLSAYLKPTVDKSEATFSWAKPDLNGLQQFCAEKLGWEQEETDNVVSPVLKVLETGSKQMRLESYFMHYDDGITFASVRSKRLKDVLSDIQGRSEGQSPGPETLDTEEDAAQPEKRQRKT